jgi:hypothetical protein
MPPVLYPPSRPQSIGEVLDSTFRIFRVTLLRCLPYGVLAMVAGQLQNIYDIVRGRPLHQFGRGDPVWWALYGVGIFIAYTFINAILIRQATMAAGSQSAARAALVAGLQKAPAAFVIILLSLLAVAACFIPLLVPVPPLFRTVEIFVLCLPAVYVGVLLSCSWTAMLIGHKGIVGSLGQSAHLVRGNWWRTVTIYLVAWAMLGVLFVSAGVIAAVLVPIAAGGDVAVTTAVSAVMVVALGAIYVPFFTAMAIALYGDLEARKEGADLQRRIVGAAAG